VYEWLIELLKKGNIEARSKYEEDANFISFSKDENSGQGESDEFGNIRVDFDMAEILKQGGIEVKYTVDFFKKNPDICLYVTDWKNEKEYNDWVKEGKRRKIEGKENTWKEHIESFDGEQEIMLTKLKYTPNLIKKVTIWDAAERDNLQDIKKTLKSYKLKVEVPWES
jgi:hypothetical protein